MQFNRGDIGPVPFPHKDLTASKARPVVTLNDPQYQQINGDLLVVFLTSNITRPHSDFDYSRQGWKALGLQKPTLMKSKLAVIHELLVQRKGGVLSQRDTNSIERALYKELFLSLPTSFE